VSAPEIQLYLDRARQDLQAAESNLHQGFHDVAITRAYYGMFYAASAVLASKGISRSKHSGCIRPLVNISSRRACSRGNMPRC